MLRMLLGEAARRFGERPAFIAGQWRLSFADLDRLSDAVAAGYAHRGVLPGDVVALALPPVPEYAICYLAAAKLGAVAAGYPLWLPYERLVTLHASVVRPRLLVATPGLGLPAVDDEVEVALSPDGVRPLPGLARPERPPPPLPPDPARPAVIVFTAGTTGLPKGAVFGYGQLEAIRSATAGTRWGGGGAQLLHTSLSHLDLMADLPAVLQSGRTTHLMREWSVADLLRRTAQLGLPMLSATPGRLALVLRHPLLDELDLSLRQIVIDGDPVPPALGQALRARFGVPVCTRYSCTEVGIGISTCPDDPPADSDTTVGRPPAGVTLSLRDRQGRTVPAGELGEILLRSPAVMSGYWNIPAATASTITKDGFVRTGDLGWVDDRGRLHVAGRAADGFVSGGYETLPAVVEAALAAHPAVEQVAVVPGPGPVAVVVPRQTRPTVAELRAFAADELGPHELPTDVVTVPELPLTAMGKIDRSALRNLVAVG